MKIAPLVIVAVSGLDPAFNKQRPIHHPVQADALPGLESLFPNHVRRDPALFNMINRKLFTDAQGKRRFNPIGDDKQRAIVDDFICTQNSMFLIHKTSDYDAFNTIDYTDFALNDANCNVDSANLAWFSVDAANLNWSADSDWTDNSGSATSDASTIEYVAAIIPLDSCGTTAELGTNDAGEDVVIFKNKIRNGAYSTIDSINGDNPTHNGITTDAVVDFQVQCSYMASYEMNSEHQTEVAMLRDELDTDAGDIFEFELDFLTPAPGKINPMTLQVDGVTMEKVLGDHAVQVGETAYAAITLKTPNDLIQMQVDGCRMKNPNGAAGMLSYDFITANCPDPFTSAKLINEPQSKNGVAVVSYTMFEFVDSNLEAFSVQNNYLECDVKICLRDQPCPGTCAAP